MKSILINVIFFALGAGIVAASVWVINLASVFKGF